MSRLFRLDQTHFFLLHCALRRRIGLGKSLDGPVLRAKTGPMSVQEGNTR